MNHLQIPLDKTFPYLLTFPAVGSSELGYVSIAEGEPQGKLPFEVKRVFWTYYTPNQVLRGQHCHHQLREIIVAVAGQIDVELELLSGGMVSFRLNDPTMGLYIPPYSWSRIRFSHTAVLMAFCSIPYTPSDYIRDHNEFLRLRSEYMIHHQLPEPVPVTTQ